MISLSQLAALTKDFTPDSKILLEEWSQVENIRSAIKHVLLAFWVAIFNKQGWERPTIIQAV